MADEGDAGRFCEICGVDRPEKELTDCCKYVVCDYCMPGHEETSHEGEEEE